MLTFNIICTIIFMICLLVLFVSGIICVFFDSNKGFKVAGSMLVLFLVTMIVYGCVNSINSTVIRHRAYERIIYRR